jgi:hypothetical protein
MSHADFIIRNGYDCNVFWWHEVFSKHQKTAKRKEIFVGYRRKDTGSAAGRLYDALQERKGNHAVFKDIDNIGPGVDFL